jgi:hypothetical protein
MNLSEKISSTIALSSQELYLLLLFVRDIDAYIRHDQVRVMLDIVRDIPDNVKPEFTEHVIEHIKALREAVSELQEPTTTKGKRRREFRRGGVVPKEIAKYFIPLVIAALKPIRYAEFFYDMVVTHTIAIFESFLNDFLVAIFTLRPNMLKSGNTATYEDILSFSSRKKLIGHLASNRAKKILEGDFQSDVADKLNKTFSIDISKFDKFNIIHEAFCRRHAIVHNDGVIDKEYCKKIPNSKIGERLSTDLQYIETLFTTIGQFIDYLDGYFSRKMRYRRNPLVNHY